MMLVPRLVHVYHTPVANFEHRNMVFNAICVKNKIIELIMNLQLKRGFVLPNIKRTALSGTVLISEPVMLDCSCGPF